MLISLLVTDKLKPHTKQFGGAPFPPEHDFEKSLLIIILPSSFSSRET